MNPKIKTAGFALAGAAGVLGLAAVIYFVWRPSAAASQLAPTPDYWPTHEWRTSTPEEQGVDSGLLADALLNIKKAGINIHSLMVIRHDAVLLDAYFYPYDGATVHELASVTKSLTTTLIGIAADQGKLSLDDPMVSFFPDRTISNLDARKQRITVRHLVSMSSGLRCTAEHDEATLMEMVASEDWVQFTLDLPVVSEPGTQYVYCSPGMHLLSAILQQATGMTEFEFARQNLFGPLGIHEVIWPADPQGYNHGWGDVYLHPHDAAKLGYLWLHDGVWEGRQVVSRQWVTDAVTTKMDMGGNNSYGYGWRIYTEGDLVDYSAIGRGGQYIKVIPYADAIMMATGGGFEFNAIDPLLNSAVVDPENPLPPNPEGFAKLEAALAALQQPPEAQPIPTLPEMASVIAGHTYVFEPNLLGVATARLDFDESAEAVLNLTFSNGLSARQGLIGLDGVYRLSPGEYGLPLGMRGQWAGPQTFVVEYDEIANRDANLLTMQFEEDRIVITAKERTHEAAVTTNGRWQD